MLYNRHLDCFIAVSDQGSFSKAAQQLYISSTAVMKQMDELEDLLGFKIFSRSNQGISLTEAGKSIYGSAKEIIQQSNQAVEKANQMVENSTYTISIGTSFLNPYQLIRNLWLQVNQEHSDFKVHIIPFEGESSHSNRILDYVGERFDIVVGGLDASKDDTNYQIHPLEYKHFNCLVSLNHPLAQHKSLKLTDLSSYSLMIAHPKESVEHDRLRQEIIQLNIEVDFKSVPFYYGMELFNQVQRTDDILLSLEGWHNIHPSLVAIPLEWDATIPYGIIYSTNAPPKVKQFIELLTRQ